MPAPRNLVDDVSVARLMSAHMPSGGWALYGVEYGVTVLIGRRTAQAGRYGVKGERPIRRDIWGG